MGAGSLPRTHCSRMPPGSQPRGPGKNSAEGELFPLEGIKNAHMHSCGAEVCQGEGGQGHLTGWPPAAWPHDSPESCWHQLRLGVCSGQRCQGREGGLSPAWHLGHVTAILLGQAGAAGGRPRLPNRPGPALCPALCPSTATCDWGARVGVGRLA